MAKVWLAAIGAPGDVAVRTHQDELARVNLAASGPSMVTCGAARCAFRGALAAGSSARLTETEQHEPASIEIEHRSPSASATWGRASWARAEATKFSGHLRRGRAIGRDDRRAILSIAELQPMVRNMAPTHPGGPMARNARPSSPLSSIERNRL
jgi:hypothetical protein